MSEDEKQEAEPIMPAEYDYERVMSQEEIDASWRVAGRTPEEEARLKEIVDAYVRAVRRAIYHEADMTFDDPEHTKELADLAWEEGWRHGTEFAQAALARRRPVLNPSRKISLTQLARIVSEEYPEYGVKNPSRLKKDFLLSGKVAYQEHHRRDTSKDEKTHPKVVVDLDDLGKLGSRLKNHPDLQP